MNDVAAEVFRLADQRPMTLVRDPRSQIQEALVLLSGKSETELFPDAAAPAAAMAGLLLGAGDWERAHKLSQDIESPDGFYWHAILHRQEPDAWNSRYWFSKVGRHPVYSALAEVGQEKLGLSGPWDAGRFVDLCMEAPGTAREPAVRAVQHVEWRLLLLHCARSAAS